MTTPTLPQLPYALPTTQAEWQRFLNVLQQFASAIIGPLTTAGDIEYLNSTQSAARLGIGPNGDVLTVVSGLPSWQTPAGGGGGTVTSVGLLDNSIAPIFAVSNSPITVSGTIDLALNNQTAHAVFAGPTTGVSQPTFRALAAADIPVLNQNTTGTAAGLSSILGISAGGTGAGSASAAYNALTPMTTTGDMEYEMSAGVAARLPVGSTNQVLTVVAGAPSWQTPAAGGGLTLLTAQVNLGTAPVDSGSFTIAGSGLTTGKPVLISQAAGPYTGKGTYTDEVEMDQIVATGYVLNSTTIACNWGARTLVAGYTQFNYQVSA